MKLHYYKILLFSLPLNILEHNNKPYITPHTSTTTSRVLSKCDLYMPKYDNNADMKSVKENFDRQTSRRFEEYKEGMNHKRQKCKEQCDKDIQQIILKEKIQKSLAEKVEQGCLRCGCGLGVVAASVGLFGGLGTYGWKISATAAAYETAEQSGIQAGIQAVIAEIKRTVAFKDIWNVEWTKILNGSNYNSISGIARAAELAMETIGKPCTSNVFDRTCNALSRKDAWFPSFVRAGKVATDSATESAKGIELGQVADTSYATYSAIGYSVIAILIILLVMIYNTRIL
ncbi:PIR protein, pseudogene, putative [Plasmodium sp.]|nr:PIR protein, pseudogene, putative [Plasmodium sp.]